jgi:hypothetical protein
LRLAFRRSKSSGSIGRGSRGLATKDFEELFGCLKARNVKALVVGGYAVAFHGRPRFTKDIDVLVEPAPDNAERLLSALADFGFGSLGLTIADFTSPGRIVQLGVAPNRIDLLTAIDGVTFDEAWAHRVAGPFGAATVDYIGLGDLIRNKQASARPQDLLDVEDLSAER